MNMYFKSIIAASVFMALAAPAGAQPPDEIQLRIKFDRSAPVTKTYKSIEMQVRQACRKANRKTTKTYKSRAVFDCQKALMEKAVRVTKMPTLLTYHNDHIGQG